MLKIRVLEHLQEGPGQDAQEVQGHGLGPEPALQEDLRAGVRHVRRRAFGCLVGDYYFDQSPPDVSCWARSPRSRRPPHAPFIAGAAPTVMKMDSWQELSNPRDLTKIFQTPEYAAWRSLRESEDSRYIGLAMPRFLSRLPYGAKTEPGGRVRLRGGDVKAPSHSTSTPGPTAAYAMARQHQPGVQALRLVLAHPRASSRGAPSRACPATPSPPTTAAWT